MVQRSLFWRQAAFVVVTVSGLIGIGAPAAAQGNSDAREVTLTLSIDDSGGCSIAVNPPTAVISRGENKRMKKVEWVAAPNAELGDLFWELRWDPEKGGGTEDYFGAVDLGCGVGRIKVQPSSKPKIPNAEWPYAVSVFSCEDGAKGRALCSVDPRIRWDD